MNPCSAHFPRELREPPLNKYHVFSARARRGASSALGNHLHIAFLSYLDGLNSQALELQRLQELSKELVQAEFDRIQVTPPLLAPPVEQQYLH